MHPTGLPQAGFAERSRGRRPANIETLRYYERRGLLEAPARLPSGYRAYDDAAVSLIRFIRRAQELGFTLAEVETLLELAAGGPEPCDAAQSLAATISRVAFSVTFTTPAVVPAQLTAVCSLPLRERLRRAYLHHQRSTALVLRYLHGFTSTFVAQTA